MVGQISYTEEQILFVLEQTLVNEKRDVILHEYKKKFDKPLSVSQLRYVKAKYGHDPEFGTAIVNRKLPDNGGNRKTAKSPSKDTSQDLPSLEQQPQLRPQNEEFPQGQSQTSTPELSGTYWFDQYAPTAYETPYGYQPILHYYNQPRYPSTTHKRQLEEPAELFSSLTARLTPTRGLNNLVCLPPTISEPAEESRAKRMRLDPQEEDFAPILAATPAQMPMNSITYQAMGQSNTNVFDVAHPVGSATPINPTITDNNLYTTNDENELSPWCQFITETDLGNRTEDPMPAPPSLQTPQVWHDNIYLNSAPAQGPMSTTTPISMATHSTTISTDTSLTFSDISWNQSFDETVFNLQSNHQASYFHSPQLLREYDPTLDSAFDQATEAALQAPAGHAIVETDTSVYGWDGDNQGQSAAAPMTVPQQFDFENDLKFSSNFEDFDWSIYLPDDDQAQEIDGQTQSGPHE
ncbi:hypothetical protein ColTof4_06898 [Colletotrichum tofieldiae]|nr:hypothetical protein ColTof3_11843 [Colletotrichum tofieldiae]GKT74475.1 hypothetical protein ColTof4_06898 [Colletotrichum tofieldiae]